LLLVVVAGCSAAPAAGPSGKLTGKVEYRGKPVRIGTVLVLSEDGKHKSSGSICPDGTYVVADAPLGKVKLLLQVPPLPESLRKKQPPGVQAPPMPKSPEAPPEELSPQQLELFQSIMNLPQKYSEPGTVSWTAAVKEGQDNRCDLKLTD
jgi:hypothetical protein